MCYVLYLCCTNHSRFLFQFKTFWCEVVVVEQFLMQKSELPWRFHFAGLKLKDNFQRCLRSSHSGTINYAGGASSFRISVCVCGNPQHFEKETPASLVANGMCDCSRSSSTTPLLFCIQSAVAAVRGRKNSIQQRARLSSAAEWRCRKCLCV